MRLFYVSFYDIVCNFLLDNIWELDWGMSCDIPVSSSLFFYLFFKKRWECYEIFF